MEQDMGRQKLVNKAIDPQSITPQQALAQITPAEAVGTRPQDRGVLPVGFYRGGVAFWDLDLAVKQPLVWAEQLHILGNLDGATAGRDLSAITVPAGAIAGTVVSGTTLAVPTGFVWFINGVLMTCAADATGTIVANWRCTLFPDAAANPLGGVYHTAWLATPVGPPPLLGQDEFSAIAVLFLIGNKPVPLRLPAGQSITGQLMNAAGAANATGVAGTIQLFGWVGKPLVA